ncbi:MAG: serine/threonine protein kinase [Acidobacteria bacterium]|nr:serine/threonine protein kinase [Acidobacteriota bacterium]
MNDLPRQKLVEIVAKHGVSVIENARRCEGLLRDYSPGFRREISVLTMAIEERVPLDLLAGKATPQQVLLGRLSQRLCDNLALSEQAARWSVYSWALALKIISVEELRKLEGNNTVQMQSSTAAPTRPAHHPVPSKTQPNLIQPDAAIAAKPFVNGSVIVSPDGKGDFTKIGEAIANVGENTRLIIRPGIYAESLIINKNIEIAGDAQSGDVVIVGTKASCLQMQTGKAIVRDLILQGRGARNGKAFFSVDIPGGELILENCDVTSDSLSCVAVHGSSANPSIKNCRIHDGADSGVYFFDNARGRLEDCEIYRNRNVGAAITQGANPFIKNCRIYEGNSGGVVVWGNGAAGTIEDCVIFKHRLANVGISEYANPTFRRCEIYASLDAGVFVQQNGYGKIEECDVYGSEDAEIAVASGGNPVLRGNSIHDGKASGVVVRDKGRALIEDCDIYGNADAGVSVNGESVAAIRRCNIKQNRKVAVRVKGESAVSVEDSDLRGNLFATWETEHGVVVERKNIRE